MSESFEFGELQLKTFRKFSEKISAISYHKGKIAIALASSYQRIEVWNYKSNTCTLTINTNGLVSRSLKFDDNIIMSMFEEIRAWDLPSGKSNNVFKGGVFRCCSFDYCKELNIVVGSFSDSSIYIWNLSTGEVVKHIDQDHGSIQKVFVYPVVSDELEEWKTINLLILKDKEVDMWTLKFNPSVMQSDTLVINKSYTVRPFTNRWREDNDPKLDSFCFNQNFLYYLKSSSDVQRNKIVVWDMQINVLNSEITVNRMVKNLLAVGSKYIALQTEIPDTSHEDSFVILDRVTEDEAIVSELPNELQGIGADGNPSVIIGETSWLDGLNEENGEDILCLCVSNRQEVHVFKRGQSAQEAINESAGICNLL